LVHPALQPELPVAESPAESSAAGSPPAASSAPRSSSLSIRSGLALLVAACVLPGSLMAVFLIFHDYTEQREQLEQNTIATARAIASALDRDLASYESALNVLASSDYLAKDDLARFYTSAKATIAYQNANNYFMLAPSGAQRLNTLRGYREPLPAGGRVSPLLKVFDADATVFSDIFVGAVIGKPILAIGVPVHLKGQIAYVLGVGISPNVFATLLRRQRLPPDWIGAILDRNGIIIARTRDMDRYVGKSGSAGLVKAAGAAFEGTVENVSLEGIPLVTAFSTSELSGWSVAVGIPQSELTAKLNRSLWLLIAATTTVLLLGLLMASYLGGRIAGAIRNLREPAMELGRGNAVSVPRLGLKEADEVGQALVNAASLLLKAQRDANHDALTDLANRALFHEILSQQLAICVRDRTELTVLFIDLDGFKAVNDEHGHAIGDELLKAVATRIRGGIRDSDLAARFGGDEFAVLLVHAGVKRAEAIAEKMVDIISAPYMLSELEVRISASIGVAVFPGAAVTITSLMDRADMAMYGAKKAGKGRYTIAELEEND
jgi:diguanylate cyclase (GGDEF)-like protein